MEPAVQKHRPAPLRLLELIFPKISIEALVPEVDVGTLPRTLDLDLADIAFRYHPGEGEESVSAGMRLKTLPLGQGEANRQLLYVVDVEAFAKFDRVGSEHRDDMAEYLRKVAAASALLGAIREQISMTTARGPWGSLTLPLIGMDAIIGRPPMPKNSSITEAPQAKRARKSKISSDA